MQLQLAVQEWKVEQEAGMGAGLGAQGHTVAHVAAAVAGGGSVPVRTQLCHPTGHRALLAVPGNCWR